ncbi:hypothetical protein OC845_002787 [Tilletia horrida]|nr:hypothetical protein OC845_002787 [Tilletia horrida]
MRYHLWFIIAYLFSCVQCIDPRILHSADRLELKAGNSPDTKEAPLKPKAVKRILGIRPLHLLGLYAVEVGLSAITYTLGYQAALYHHKSIIQFADRKPDKPEDKPQPRTLAM